MKKYLLKISGAGNRFLLADGKWFKNMPPSEWIRHSYQTKKNFEDFLKLSKMSFLERRHFMEDLISPEVLSLTDGLVVLKENGKFLFSCDFYNKDGSMAEMCGNAACCVSFYAQSLSYPLGAFRLGEEIISCALNGGIVLNKALVPIADFVYDFNGRPVSFTFIKPGVPHGVIECSFKEDSVSFKDKAVLKKIAQTLRFKNPENNKGMNVSFFQIEKEGQLEAITYERGVENFTLACGTGALAVAFVYLSKYRMKHLKAIFINMPGGELKVQLDPQLSLFSPVVKGY